MGKEQKYIKYRGAAKVVLVLDKLKDLEGISFAKEKSWFPSTDREFVRKISALHISVTQSDFAQAKSGLDSGGVDFI